MIKKIVKNIKKVFTPESELEKINDLEAPIHECGPSHFSHGYSPYIGVPAPTYLQDDPWFGPAPNLSEKQQDYMKQETEVKKQEERRKEELRASGHVVEDKNIHQKMYEIASKNWNTVSESQGGSENFHQGPGGWNSGTGINQFRENC